MARGINKAILIGNLGNDPEIRITTNNKSMTTISLATTETWKDKQSNERQERTEWHRIVFFGGLAEVVGKYLHKGSKVYVEGSIRTRKWQDKTGIDRYTTEIVATDMHMLDRSDKSNAPYSDSADSYMGYPEARTDISVQQSHVDNTVDQKINNPTLDDDIPF